MEPQPAKKLTRRSIRRRSAEAVVSDLKQHIGASGGAPIQVEVITPLVEELEQAIERLSLRAHDMYQMQSDSGVFLVNRA